MTPSSSVCLLTTRIETMENDGPTMGSVAYMGDAGDTPAGLPVPVNGSAPAQVSQGDDGLADTVMRTVVSSGNDALNLLFRAAEQRDAQSPQYQTPGSHRSRVGGDFATPGRASTVPTETVQLSHAQPSVLEVWSALRFTRMGWFTAEEAVTYMDLCVLSPPLVSAGVTLISLDFSRTSPRSRLYSRTWTLATIITSG